MNATLENNVDLKELLDYQIFEGLQPEEVEYFVQKFQYFNSPEGDIILKEGDEGNSLFLLLTGEVEVSQALTMKVTTGEEPDTREKAITRLSGNMHPFFGEMSIFTEHDTRSATIRAVKKCSLAEITREDFFAVIRAHPEFGIKVLANVARVLVSRLKKTNDDVMKLTTALTLILEQH